MILFLFSFYVKVFCILDIFQARGRSFPPSLPPSLPPSFSSTYSSIYLPIYILFLSLFPLRKKKSPCICICPRVRLSARPASAPPPSSRPPPLPPLVSPLVSEKRGPGASKGVECRLF